jgi:hypothetical protein
VCLGTKWIQVARRGVAELTEEPDLRPDVTELFPRLEIGLEGRSDEAALIVVREVDDGRIPLAAGEIQTQVVSIADESKRKRFAPEG